MRANKGNETRLSLIFDRIRCDTLIHGTELGEGEGEEINVRELQRRVEGEGEGEGFDESSGFGILRSIPVCCCG